MAERKLKRLRQMSKHMTVSRGISQKKLACKEL